MAAMKTSDAGALVSEQTVQAQRVEWRRQLDGNLHPDKGAEDLAIEVVARSGAQ
jgi:hypothetical protein